MDKENIEILLSNPHYIMPAHLMLPRTKGVCKKPILVTNAVVNKTSTNITINDLDEKIKVTISERDINLEDIFILKPMPDFDTKPIDRLNVNNWEDLKLSLEIKTKSSKNKKLKKMVRGW